MLGRLEMDVDECIKAYSGLMKTVFEKKKPPLSLTFNIKARFSSKVLESAIKQIIGSREGVSIDDSFYVKAEDKTPPKCKV
jgi:hypothetical protein